MKKFDFELIVNCAGQGDLSANKVYLYIENELPKIIQEILDGKLYAPEYINEGLAQKPQIDYQIPAGFDAGAVQKILISFLAVGGLAFAKEFGTLIAKDTYEVSKKVLKYIWNQYLKDRVEDEFGSCVDEKENDDENL